MPGKVRELIERLVAARTKGQAGLEPFVRAQLVMRGIHPDRYDAKSDDDPVVLQKLEQMLREFT